MIRKTVIVALVLAELVTFVLWSGLWPGIVYLHPRQPFVNVVAADGRLHLQASEFDIDLPKWVDNAITPKPPIAPPSAGVRLSPGALRGPPWTWVASAPVTNRTFSFAGLAVEFVPDRFTGSGNRFGVNMTLPLWMPLTLFGLPLSILLARGPIRR